MRNFRKAQLKQKRRENRKRKGKVKNIHSEEQTKRKETFIGMIASAMKKAKEAAVKRAEAKKKHDDKDRYRGVSVLKIGQFTKKKNGEVHVYQYERWGDRTIRKVLVA